MPFLLYSQAAHRLRRKISCKRIEFSGAKVPQVHARFFAKIYNLAIWFGLIYFSYIVTWGRTVAWQLHRHQTQRKISEDTKGRRSLEFVWCRTWEKNFVCWRRFEGEGKVRVRTNSLDEKSGGQTHFIQDQGLINKPMFSKNLNFVMDLA